MKALRITLLAIVGITAVIAAAAAIFVATFDANRYKPEIEQLVLENTGRVLTIDGDVHLTLFPNIGAEVGQATLSDKDPGQTFVAVQSTNVSVELWPLLSGQVFVDGVTIDGLSATITRDKAGAFNFADLVSGDQTADDKADQAKSAASSSASSSANPASSFALDIRSVTVTNASLTFNDLQNRMDWTISELNLSTGQIARQASGKLKLAANVESQTMALDGKLNIESDYKIDLATRQLSLNQISSQLSGNWRDIKDVSSDLKLNLDANLKDNAFAVSDLDLKGTANLEGQSIELTTNASSVKSKGNDIEVEPSALNLTIKEPGRALSTELALPAFTFTGETLAINGLDTGLSVTDPALGKEPLKVTAKGDLTLNTKAQTVATVLNGQFDGSPIKARVDVAGFDQPAITFDVALDELKLDRFGATNQTASSGSETNAANNEITNGASNGTSNGRSAAQATQTDTIDLSALKGPNIKGKVSIGQVLSGGLREGLRQGLRINQVKANVALNQGKLQVAPHSAELFGGKLEGSLLVDAYTNRFTLKENITGIKLDSLLTALGQDPKVTGQGALTLDLATTGTTVASLEQNLSGNARVNLKDGSVKGIDIGKILNNVRGLLGKAPTQQGSGSGQTAFTELAASATIAKGIATNKDLSVKAPLFRLEGAGMINIPDSSLNYLAKVAVVETSEGQGGKDLAALKGVTVPIRISGQFNDPKYSVDVASLAAELAKSKLGDQLGDRARDEINKVAPGLGDAIKGLFGR